MMRELADSGFWVVKRNFVLGQYLGLLGGLSVVLPDFDLLGTSRDHVWQTSKY